MGPVEVGDELAIEVVWTSGGLDKLEIYRLLGVNEVWIWREDRIEVYLLQGEQYERGERSELLPDLDLLRLEAFIDPEDQTGAVRAWRASLRGS